MKYVCDICGWVYDEDEGYPEGGIAPGTKWEDVPEDFECPVCYVGTDQFSEADESKVHVPGEHPGHFLCSGAFPGTSGPVFRLKNRAAPHNCVCALRRSFSANSAVLP